MSARTHSSRLKAGASPPPSAAAAAALAKRWSLLSPLPPDADAAVADVDAGFRPAAASSSGRTTPGVPDAPADGTDDADDDGASSDERARLVVVDVDGEGGVVGAAAPPAEPTLRRPRPHSKRQVAFSPMLSPATFRQPRAPIGSIPRQSSLPLHASLSRHGSSAGLSELGGSPVPSRHLLYARGDSASDGAGGGVFVDVPVDGSIGGGAAFLVAATPGTAIASSYDGTRERHHHAPGGARGRSRSDSGHSQEWHVTAGTPQPGAVGAAAALADLDGRPRSTSLLQHPLAALTNGPDAYGGRAVPAPLPPPSLWAAYRSEVRELLTSALPVVTSSSLTSLLTIVDLVFIGQWLGPAFLAAGSLGNAYFNILYVLMSGAADAVDKACGAAIASGNLPELGMVAQRGVVLLLAAAVPVMGALAVTTPALTTLFHQGTSLADTAGVFCGSLIAGMVPLAAFLALTVVLRSQAGAGMSSSATWHIIYIDGLANVLNVAANGALIEVDGFLGAPLATSLSRLVQLALLAWYLYTYRPFARHGTWSGWHLREAVCGSAGGGREGDAEATSTTPASTPVSAKAGGFDDADSDGAASPRGRLASPQRHTAAPSGWASAATATAAASIPLLPMVGSALASAGQLAIETWVFEATYLMAGWLPATSAAGAGAAGALQGDAAAAAAAATPGFLARLFSLGTAVTAADPTADGSGGAFAPDTDAINAHSVLLNVSSFLFVGVPLGLSVAGASRVATLLAGGDGRGARATALATVTTGVLFMTAAAFVTLLARRDVGRIFTQEPGVNALVSSVAAYAAVFQTIDGYQGTLAGVLRGAGWARQVAVVNALGWWAVGLPAAATLALGYGRGLAGIWQGMCAANASLAVSYTILYWRTDWDAAAAAAVAAAAAAGAGYPQQGDGGGTEQQQHPQGARRHAGKAPPPTAADGMSSDDELDAAPSAAGVAGATAAVVEAPLHAAAAAEALVVGGGATPPREAPAAGGGDDAFWTAGLHAASGSAFASAAAVSVDGGAPAIGLSLLLQRGSIVRVKSPAPHGGARGGRA
jgi:Na+-driven multidrug efflux pump